MSRLNLSVIVEKDKNLQDNLNAALTLIKNSIPDQGAQVIITIAPLPQQHCKLTLHDIFPHIFKPIAL